MTSFRFLTRYQVVKPVLIGHSMAEENYHYRHWAPSVRTGLFTWMLRVTLFRAWKEIWRPQARNLPRLLIQTCNPFGRTAGNHSTTLRNEAQLNCASFPGPIVK
jgi:hypothetical protein